MAMTKEEYKNQISSAWKKYEEKDSESAKELCLQIKTEYPDQLGVNYLLGIISFDEKEFEDSIRALKHALRKDDEKKAGGFINYWIGRNYGEKTFSLENPIYNKDLSRVSYEKALEYESYPEDVISQLNYIYQNDFKLIDLYKRATKKFPENLNFYLSLSTAYEKVGQAEEQEKILLQANEKLKSSHILFELGQLSLKKKNCKVARKYFQSAEKLNKNKGTEFALQVMIANTHKEEGALENAKKIYIDAFNKERNSENFWFGLIGVLMCERDSDYPEFITLLTTMEVTKQFIIDDWFGDMPIYLDSQIAFGIDLPFNEKDSIKKLNILKKTQKNEDILGKIELIKYSLYKHLGNRPKRIKSLKESTKFLNTYHYDFILNELAESYSDMFYHLVEEKKSIDKLIKEIISTLKNEYSFRDVFIEHVESIIEELHKQKKYQEEIKIYDLLSKQQVDKADIWFEVGYAFNELGNFKKSKYSYNRVIELKGETSAVLNNLALLLEGDDDWISAKELFEKAVKLGPDDVTAQNNLQRLTKKIKVETKNIERWEKNQREALKNVKNENVYIHQKLFCLIDSEDDDKNIIASYGQLSGILKASPEKVQELLKNFLNKNYITKVQDHNIDTNSNVYRVNNIVRRFVLKRKQRIEENKDLSVIGERINIDSLENLGFDKHLLSKIDSKISDTTLKAILKRDLRENVLALLTDSYKTVLVLSGSVIETLIMNRVLDSGITSHLPSSHAKKRKKVITMNLSELLFTADENKIIEIQLYHFSQALKQYRNYIHPAVEIRKGKSKEITKRDAKLAWELTKKIIFEI